MREPWSCRHVRYLLIILNVLVGHPHEQLPEVLPLVVLPPLHVGLQISIETLHPILTLFNIHWHLEWGGVSGYFVHVTGFLCLKFLCSLICEGPNFYIEMPQTQSLLEAFIWRQGLGFSGLRRNSVKATMTQIFKPIRAQWRLTGEHHPHYPHLQTGRRNTAIQSHTTLVPYFFPHPYVKMCVSKQCEIQRRKM